jgi:hypothetical protein
MSSEEYRRAMETLARETTMPPATAARIERQLMDAFASRDSADVVASPGMKRVIWHSRSERKPIAGSWRPWLPAAAAIVLVAGVAFLASIMNRQPPPTRDHHTGPRAAIETPTPPRVVDETVNRRPLDSTTTSGASSPHPTSRAPQKTNVVTPSGFVDLPWTAGLPAFESGEIVRMDVPVASLPAYGIDISSGTGKGPVEADVLIGQDGFARAIRLVKSTARSTQ